MKQQVLISVSTYRGSRQYAIHSGLIWASCAALLSVFICLGVYQSHIQQLRYTLEQSQLAQQQAEKSVHRMLDAEQLLFQKLDQQHQQLFIQDAQLQDLESLANVNTPISAPMAERFNSTLWQLQQRRMMLSKIPSGQPLDYRRISSRFGTRTHPISKRRHTHVGIDLRADKGVPVYATADGYVQLARSNYDKGYGNMVTMSHQMGFVTRYAHLDDVSVKYGQFVRKGDLVGHCGNSGDSTASHLHYEIRFLNKALDPKPFMAWNLGRYEQIFDTVRTLPWDSFQAEIALQLQPLEQQLSLQAPSSRVPSSSAATFMSTEK